MAEPLACLRGDLDFMPSPVADRPGLLIRDPQQYSDSTLIVPPGLVECLDHFNGASTELDLRAHLVRLSGTIEVGEIVRQLHDALSQAGFLDDDVYRGLRDESHKRFADAPMREATHAGSAYPDQADALRGMLDGYFEQAASRSGTPDGLLGIAAPHVSPEGGYHSYAAAYRSLAPELEDRIFVVLGTSHFGAPNRFGLTRKPFQTPYGVAHTETALVDFLAERAPDAVEIEDYCHRTEHSIEFQTVFLQHVFGPEIRILPILCGSFARSIHNGGDPEDNEAVRRFIEALGEMVAREGKRLFWVLGVDMAHMGKRYGDPYSATADTGYMAEVAGRDRKRIERIETGDTAGFWELVRENEDDLKWCGTAPFYTFLRAVPDARGRLLDYRQWNIDPQSVVSFGAMAFESPAA